jgi:sortase A
MAADLLDDLAAGTPRKRRRGFAALGVVLVLIGIAAAGWVGWQFLGTTLIAQQRHTAQLSELRTQWELGDAPLATERPPPGQAFAMLRVPTFGDRYEVPIIAGVEKPDLARGVGAYPSSVLPGQIGNFAVAGYRTTHAAPFGKLLELQPGDEVVIETREATYTYVLDVGAAEITVADTAAWVLDPVPGRPGADASQPTLTLTTSQDLIRSPDRSIAFGHLASTRNK